jgi:hypothetical protein
LALTLTTAATLGELLLEFLLPARRQCIPLGLQLVAQSVFLGRAHRFELGPQLLMKRVPLIRRHRHQLIAVITRPHHRQLRRKEMVPMPRTHIRSLVAGRRTVFAGRRRAVLALIGRRRAVLPLVGWRRRILCNRRSGGAQQQAGRQAGQQEA